MASAMPRLFVALSLPQATRIDLAMLGGGVPGARWVQPENFHITLRFIGEVQPGTAEDLHDALSAINAYPIDISIKGCGVFGKDMPRSIWAGVEPDPALTHLQSKIERACQRMGLPADKRNFMPHVTLARLRNAPPEKVQRYVEEHGLYRAPPFRVSAFDLYSSELSHEGSIYHLEASYPLNRAAA